MKNQVLNRKIKIQNIDYSEFDKISLSDHIIIDQIDKSNNLYLLLRKQYLDWKNILIDVLSNSTNKSIALYIMFLTVEIYIKAECVKEFNIINFDDRVENVSYKKGVPYFQLKQIGHGLNYFFEVINDSSKYPKFTNLSNLKEIQQRIDDLNLYDTVINNYMSLRYNCNLNGEFLYKENNMIEDNEKKKIREVINNVL